MFDDNEEHYKHDRHRQLPIFLKAEEIYQLVNSMLARSDPKELQTTEFMQDVESEMVAQFFQHNKESMWSNAMTIPTKIAGAEGGDIYDIRMENATIIRKAARELIIDARGLQMNGFKDVEYLDLLRGEMEEFRLLFVEWVSSFDKTNFNIDRWGLFNPPGINYDDHDPDHDLPFDPDSLDEF